MQPLIPAPPAHDHTAIPIYQLYGYGNVWTRADPFFCETIAAQEKLHHWHVEPHKHVDLFQVLYLESGEVTVTLDARPQTLTAPHMVLVPQGVVHEFLFRPESEGYIRTLTDALLHDFAQRAGFALYTAASTLVPGTTEDDQQAITCLHSLNREYRRPHSPQRGPMLEALLMVLLVWISRRQRASDSAVARQDPGSQHLAHYAKLIEDNHAAQHRVTWYAQRIGVTAAHLNAIARDLTGRTASQMISDRLLLQARRELIYTPRTIAVIAESLGFVDTSYFARFFKRLDGASPKDFRQSVLNRTPEM